LTQIKVIEEKIDRVADELQLTPSLTAGLLAVRPEARKFALASNDNEQLWNFVLDCIF
jgi:hypothetical protein